MHRYNGTTRLSFYKGDIVRKIVSTYKQMAAFALLAWRSQATSYERGKEVVRQCKTELRTDVPFSRLLSTRSSES